MLISDTASALSAPLPVSVPFVPIVPLAAHMPAPHEDPLARIRPLLQRFRLPDLSGEDEGSARAEAEACAANGMGDVLYLVCLLGCLARCTSGGPLVVDGVWRASAVLAACGIACIVEGVLESEDQPDPTALLRSGEVGPPRLLCGEEPTELLDLLRLELPSLHVETRRSGTLQLSMASGGEDADGPPVPVELARSVLLALVRRLQQQVEQQTGLWIDEQCAPTVGESIGRDLALLWQPHLPELPRWVRTPSGGAASGIPGSAAETWRDWCATAPAALPAHARVALETRAHLAWFFSYLAARYPAAAWSVLLSSGALADTEGIAASARAAGYTLALPTVQEPHLDWEPTDDRTLRCGLSCLGVTPVLVAALRASLAQDGAFASAFDLAERVTQVAGQFLPLAASGALDMLHPRALLLGSWGHIALWLRQAAAARADGEPLPPRPELVACEESSSRQRLWAAVCAPGTPAALDMVAAAPTADDACVLPFDVGQGAAGERIRVGGIVRERRMVHDDGDALVVLVLSDGRATVQVLLPWDGAAASLEPGCWASCGALRTPDRRVLLDPALAASPASRPVRVTVPRSGDRETDLGCIVRVHEVLDAHPGRHPVAIALQQGERRRLLDLGAPTLVAWTPSLVEELEAVVGRRQVAIEDAGV